MIAIFVYLDFYAGYGLLFVQFLEELGTGPMAHAFTVAFVAMIGLLSYTVHRRGEVAAARAAQAQAESTARRAALTDHDTGVLNRLGLIEAVASLPADRPFGIVALRSGRQRIVSLRSEKQDAATLAELLGRMRVALGAPLSLARSTDDLFAIVPWNASLGTLTAQVAAVVESMHEPLRSLGGVSPPFAAAGFTVVPLGDRPSAESLVRQAEIALHHAIRQGNGEICAFSLAMEAELIEQEEVVRSLPAAMRAEEIQPFYQPLVHLPDNRLLGFEILGRWVHPSRGLIPPNVFLPIAEELGLMPELTKSLLRQACADALQWPGAPKLALNVVPADLRDAGLATELLAICRDAGFPTQRLEIEITEQAFVADSERVRSTIGQLREQGVTVGLDDFGTGFSSLYHLRILPLDKLKIDQSFVRTLDSSPESHSIVRAIVALAKSLDMAVLAEGIERPEHARLLVDLGCTLGQGFLFSRPLPSPQALVYAAHAARVAASPAAIAVADSHGPRALTA